MAATYPRRTRPPGSTSYQYNRLSPGPSFTVRIRKGSRDAIPHGAVASRVKLLQSLKEPQPTKPGSPTPKRTREDSRSGFGRRVSRRFGNPAIQSAQPDETPRVDSRHSFLGLNVVRTNHEEEHACADPTIQYSRSPGINGQIDQGADARKQYDAASPWGALSRTKSVRTVSHRGHSPDLDVLKEIDSLGNHTRYMTQTSIFPSTAKKDNAGMYRHQVKPRRSKFIDSEASIATTSTIRRQNVRDLFDDYGIQRPAGLASREVSQDLDTSRVDDAVNIQSRFKTHASNAHYQHASETNAENNYGPEKKFRSNEAPKPPPPPTLVPSPWEETITKTREVKGAKITTVEKAVDKIGQPKPPSKENTPIFQRTPQEHSSFETSAQPTDGTWFTIPSPHEHDHIHERRNSCPPSRKNSLEKDNHGVEMTGALSPRTQTTPPESEKASRKLSATLKEKDQSSVQALKQQLLSHREELQKIQQDCTEQINLSAHSGVAELAQRIEQKTNKDDPYRVTRTPSICSKGSAGSKKKNWKLKLVDWNPEGKKKAGEEHRLSDDEVVSEKDSYKAMPSVSTASLANWMDFSGESEGRKEAGKEHSLSVDEVVREDYERGRGGERDREHDCVWKKRFEEVGIVTRTEIETETEKKDLGILGVTVLVHLVGREDLVARAEGWTGGELKGD
ncbi:hypothetical protein IFR05_001884 [Cadophora sp. M221]|nr:hypothetical protein IFR05_001884 [Cadophora sp. M221]